jgi:Ca2+-binding RTX toxin-like protein
MGVTVWKTKRVTAAVTTLLLASGLAASVAGPAQGAPGPVGNGFTVTAGDLSFILRQIKIAEHHAVTQTPANLCGTLVGPGPDQIPDRLTPYGLRTVDGSCNNLFPGRENFAAADVPFPRLTTPVFKNAEPITASLPVGPPGPTSYAQKQGNVVDSQPRVISNLIDDQTSTNPAAIAAANSPVRSQSHIASAVPCTTDPAGTTPGVPAGCTPAHQTLFIPNVTTDVGLSPPYNSLFTFFGQFFDHGVDQTVKSGSSVFVPLKADDPLIAGPDHILGNADDLPPQLRFMVLTRAQNQPGPDGVIGTADDIQNANNTDSPWVDQSQTYSSHPSHQVFLREYVSAPGGPVSTGKLLGGLPAGQTYLNSPDGTTGIGTWAAVKLQAANVLGLKLVDADVTNIPMLAVDPYGKFIPGPARGLPQYVTTTGTVEGNTAGGGVPVPANALHFDTPFLTDIAHNADPSPQDTDNNPNTPPVAPTPDADNTPSADFANQPAGTYDDEMLNAHFACGDGRCNENIALSTIHQVFHSEHDRLVDYIKNVLETDTSAAGVAALADWKSSGQASDYGYNYGERLFQAARYVTEMEYQHLVFEEFARKVQPAVRPFHVYSPDINPAIKAEFAHAVYRFGHSMLDDTVARTNIGGGDNSTPLLNAFLNPPEYFNGGAAGTLTPEQAAGSVIMGSSDQTGNELDEFVTETLRNNLLGLPLDLPTLNLTRAREAGVAPLNSVRRDIFGQTNDGQLAPYTSWSDYGQHLKHPESLINFVAAYGLHPSITGATTLVAKRNAARAIVAPAAGDVAPVDAADFMFGTGAWANSPGGVTTTGLDNVDLWVGGLAEVTNLFGGLLGSTFNYVFQNQLENLQDGDRLYYLNRTQGMNLRTQLEGNSFAELIQRNTDGTNTLKADAFATADCKFQLGNLTSPAAAGSVNTGADSVNDDPTTTDCNENLLLLRRPADGTIAYRAINTVNPSGINSQSVYQGTDGPDRVIGGNDNDTFWGGKGNDVIEGNGGDDVALGGEGNDIITDLSGADVLKGGPGNDAIDGGIGDDILLGGDGQDFINGGANDNETFAGPGNDFIVGGQGADTVFGDGGDDWIQGGSGQDLLQGDHGAAFFDDPAEIAPGNDIFVGQVGENDYDAEGGDDIMAQNAAIDRNAGSGGFDWAIHQYNTIPADDDMMINNNLGGLPIQVIVNRDRWQETEADSGSKFDDVIKGQDGVLATPRLVGGAGFTGCDALDQAGVARVNGLADLLPPVAAWLGNAADVAALAASGRCPLTGKVWGEGDILLGGPGSDTFTGRAGNEIIDGDKELRVAITVRTDPANPATETGRTDLMENAATSGNFGAGTAGMTLQQAIFAGLVDPGNLVAVREIVSPAAGTDTGSIDTSVYAGLQANYTVTTVPAGAALGSPGSVTTVTDNVGTDGTDTLTNVEKLQFADTATPGAPTGVTATGGVGTATVNWVAPVLNRVPQVVTSYSVEVRNSVTGVVGALRPAAGNVTTLDITGLAAGSYTFRVLASNSAATPTDGPFSLASGATTVTSPATPGAPTIGTATGGNASATVRWTAPADPGGSAITSYVITVRTGTTVVRTVTGVSAALTSTVVNTLTNGTAYNFLVHAVNNGGAGPDSAASNVVTPAVPVTAPGAPTIGTATAGNAQATLTWTAPASNGGSAITGYTVTILNAANVTLGTRLSAGTGTSLVVTALTNGQAVHFRVAATNSVGTGGQSGDSNVVTPVAPTAPGAPTGVTAVRVIVPPSSGTIRVTWTAPASNGGSAITGYTVQILNAANGLVGTRLAGTATTLVVTGLVDGTSYHVTVTATNAIGTSVASAPSGTVIPATVPGQVPTPTAVSGTLFGAVNATVNWVAPASNGGTLITSYRISAQRFINPAGTISFGAPVVATAAANLRTLTMGLPSGTYRFTVQASNAVGAGPVSARSNLVTAR